MGLARSDRVVTKLGSSRAEVDTRYFSSDAQSLSSPIYFDKDADESNTMITLPRYLNSLVVQAGKGEDLKNVSFR